MKYYPRSHAFACHGGFLYGEDTLSALNSAKMAIIFPRTVSGFKAVKLGIFDFFDHPDEADAIRQAGRKRVVENYTWKKAWPAILETALSLAN